MNSLFKRSAIGLVVLGITGSALASHQAMNNNAMWSPQITGVFLGAEGLYLRPQNGDLDYLKVPSGPLAGAVATHINAISPDYQWGWRVYAGIKFTEDDDLTLSWLNFNHSYSDTTLSDSAFKVPRFIGNSLFFTGVTGTAKFDWNEAYAVWGHTIHFNNPWSLRFAAGVEYASIDSDLSVTPVTVAGAEALATTYEASSNMQGWGPRFEADLNYGLPYGLAWFLRTNIALLSSSRSISASQELADGATATLGGLSFDNDHVIIPKLGMKIGASYSYLFGQAGAEGVCGTTLTLELGWQADAFIHAIDRPVQGSLPTILSAGFDHAEGSDFTSQGLFVGLKVSSDWI